MAANADPTFEGLRFVAEGGHSEQCRGENSCATVLWNFISAPTSLWQGQKALIVLRHDFEPPCAHYYGHTLATVDSTALFLSASRISTLGTAGPPTL
jgi:hypothetical protein